MSRYRTLLHNEHCLRNFDIYIYIYCESNTTPRRDFCWEYRRYHSDNNFFAVARDCSRPSSFPGHDGVPRFFGTEEGGGPSTRNPRLDVARKRGGTRLVEAERKWKREKRKGDGMVGHERFFKRRSDLTLIDFRVPAVN